jgi:hypothetical protein
VTRLGKYLAALAWLIWLPNGLIDSDAVHGLEYDVRGQLSGWTVESLYDNQWENTTGIRYIPTLSIRLPLKGNAELDTEISVNGYWTSDENDEDNQADMDIYRLWLRLSSSQYEIRAGLQKIDFGSAVLLRPLMWFDRVDPRDPLRLTEGVYALLGRYYFLNNTNIWVWGLVGNDETKGWEDAASHEERPEYGGRVQTALGNGEIAFAYHHREVDTADINAENEARDSLAENRFALDGKWDMGVGLWFEGVLIHQDLDSTSLPYRKFLNIGLDYTFDIVNGLTIIGENLWLAASEDLTDPGEAVAYSAASLAYPLGILDSVSAIAFYEWDNQDIYRYISWERRYDNWRFYVMGFWNPETLQIYENEDTGALFAGQGVQALIVFNH